MVCEVEKPHENWILKEYKQNMNDNIRQAIDFTRSVLYEYKDSGKQVACSVSGGADSDILIDVCERILPHYVNYVFFDTGIEYSATKEHLKYLEDKYQITIIRQKAKIPVPLGNKKYGVPFLSKRVSDMIYRLQLHNFTWEDKPFEELYSQFPRCKCALLWWCNAKGDGSHFNINRNTWLKEFLIKNPPPFSISNKCCDGAKKRASDLYMKNYPTDLMITGVRRAEGGERATNYKEYLYYNKQHKVHYLLPILFFSDADRKEYEEEFQVIHSDCYTKYGLKRTGCAGCPFGKEYNFELDVIHTYEPKLYKAVDNMWREVYAYTNKYHEFQRMMNLKFKKNKKCSCGSTEFDGDTVAMNLKYYGRNCTKLFCKKCFQENMNMNEDEWISNIENFKMQGCQLF